MMKKKLRFGIIGAGSIAAVHAEAINAAGNTFLKAVYDCDATKSTAFGKRFGIKSCTHLDEFLADPAIEAVSIATPSGLHCEVVLPAARARKHILCEKPLEINVEKCDEIIAACAENGVMLSSIFQTRFARAAEAVKQAVDAGRFGIPVYAGAEVCWYRTPAYYQSAPWRGTLALDGGGALMNQAIHTIDLLLYFNGDVEEIYGRTANRLHTGIEVEDTAAAMVRFRNGSLGTIVASTACAPGFPRRLELNGTRGSAVIEGDRIVRWIFDEERPEDNDIRRTCAEPEGLHGGAGNMNIEFEGHRRQFAEFADAVLCGRPLRLSGSDGRRAVALICGVYRANHSGRPICLSRQEKTAVPERMR